MKKPGRGSRSGLWMALGDCPPSCRLGRVPRHSLGRASSLGEMTPQLGAEGWGAQTLSCHL